jgi:hypothetical protein
MYMAKKPNTDEALDTLTAAMRAKTHVPQAIRRSMESQIEQKAKKRRGEALAARRRRK